MTADSVTVSFTLYTLAIVGLGLYSARFSKESESDFFLAGRGLGPWVAALSSSASAESGWVTLGLVGMAYSTGIGALWIVLGTFVAFLVNWFVLAWRLREQSEQYHALTLVDFLASPWQGLAGQLVRVAGVLVILSMLVAYVAAQLNAAGKTFEGIFDWDYRLGVVVGFCIIVVYTVTGGFRAIAWTDVVQAMFMILTVVILPVVLISNIGGPAAFLHALNTDAENPALLDPFAGRTGLALVGFLALWLGIPLGNPGQPHVLVRLMAVRDRSAILRGGVISSAWVLLLFGGAVLLGMSARVYFSNGLADPEQTLMAIARDSTIVPGFVGGMIIAAVLAAICSTADSQLLVAASAISHDIVVRLFGVELSLRARRVLDRSAVILLGFVALLIASGEVRSVFSFVLDYGWAGLGAAFGPATIFLLCWKWTTGWGLLTGMLVGVTTAILWRMLLPELHRQLYSLVPAFALSSLAIVAVSLLTPAERRPVPGPSTATPVT